MRMDGTLSDLGWFELPLARTFLVVLACLSHRGSTYIKADFLKTAPLWVSSLLVLDHATEQRYETCFL